MLSVMNADTDTEWWKVPGLPEDAELLILPPLNVRQGHALLCPKHPVVQSRHNALPTTRITGSVELTLMFQGIISSPVAIRLGSLYLHMPTYSSAQVIRHIMETSTFLWIRGAPLKLHWSTLARHIFQWRAVTSGKEYIANRKLDCICRSTCRLVNCHRKDTVHGDEK